MFWKISFQCEASSAPELGNMLEEHVEAVGWFETPDSRRWTVEAITTTPPQEEKIKALLAPACTRLDIHFPSLTLEKMPETDWLEATWRNFPPQQIGRYYIHGSHTPPSASEGMLSIEINAATAFGSGEHETTTACLLILDKLAGQGRKFHKPLDMGCGSGILGIAIAKTWNQQVTAADNDPESVRVTRSNATLNNCASLIQAYESEGFASQKVKGESPYDLIVANILANPLIEMAPSLFQCLASQGTVILSGLLTDQVSSVVKAYEKAKIFLISRQTLNGWEALLLEKH